MSSGLFYVTRPDSTKPADILTRSRQRMMTSEAEFSKCSINIIYAVIIYLLIYFQLTQQRNEGDYIKTYKVLCSVLPHYKRINFSSRQMKKSQEFFDRTLPITLLIFTRQLKAWWVDKQKKHSPPAGAVLWLWCRIQNSILTYLLTYLRTCLLTYLSDPPKVTKILTRPDLTSGTVNPTRECPWSNCDSADLKAASGGGSQDAIQLPFRHQIPAEHARCPYNHRRSILRRRSPATGPRRGADVFVCNTKQCQQASLDVTLLKCLPPPF